jgi:hypothetical protein
MHSLSLSVFPNHWLRTVRIVASEDEAEYMTCF